MNRKIDGKHFSNWCEMCNVLNALNLVPMCQLEHTKKKQNRNNNKKTHTQKLIEKWIKTLTGKKKSPNNKSVAVGVILCMS